MEVETIKKSQRETTLEMDVETKRKGLREKNLKLENLGKKSGAIDASITNRIQKIEERISSTEDTIENIDTTIKENMKCKKILTQNIQEIQDTMTRSILRIKSTDEKEVFQLKGPVNIINKIVEENFPTLNKRCP